MQVIRDVTPQTKEGKGISKEAAVENAKRLMPKGAEVDQETVFREGKQGTQSVQVYSEEDARESVQKQFLEGDEIKRRSFARSRRQRAFLASGVSQARMWCGMTIQDQ